jgi:hypothetical protein
MSSVEFLSWLRGLNAYAHLVHPHKLSAVGPRPLVKAAALAPSSVGMFLVPEPKWVLGCCFLSRTILFSLQLALALFS